MAAIQVVSAALSSAVAARLFRMRGRAAGGAPASRRATNGGRQRPHQQDVAGRGLAGNERLERKRGQLGVTQLAPPVAAGDDGQGAVGPRAVVEVNPQRHQVLQHGHRA